MPIGGATNLAEIMNFGQGNADAGSAGEQVKLSVTIPEMVLNGGTVSADSAAAGVSLYSDKIVEAARQAAKTEFHRIREALERGQAPVFSTPALPKL